MRRIPECPRTRSKKQNAEQSNCSSNFKETRGQLQLAFSGGKLPPPFRGLNQYHVLWAIVPKFSLDKFLFIYISKLDVISHFYST
jgi:hypothetical protein